MRATTTESSVLRGALKLKSAAQYLSVSPITVRRLVGSGQLKANRATRHYLFSIRELDRWLADSANSRRAS
jgi:excisionase family DNA binding protein